MRTIPKWADIIQDSEKQGQCIYDLCFNPDGSQLIVTGGNRILVYDATDGSLIQALKGHKDTVYCLNYAKNGQKFASGSADKTVIIWSDKLEGLLKYSHGDAIQCLAYNPLSNQLASCAITDFAFWSAEQKSVQKHKINARINACSWTNDGQYLALALGNGAISIRNKSGEEKGRFERPATPSIWAISWSISNEEQDILCVADWNKSLAFYTLGGKLIGKERNIGFDALKVKYFAKGEFILIAGSNKACQMYTKDGIKLSSIGDQQNSWVWCCAVHPDENCVALGCQDGTIAFYQLVFNTVHGLYKERYAYRENMTDVIIQHLITEQKVRIKCRDLIKKIAIYKHRLAVQLPERVVIYELYSNDANDMHYRVKEKISQKLDCNLLVVCSEHLVVCMERKLQSMNFHGTEEREWLLESSIRYIKIIGGPPRQEGLILGLKNGQVWEVHLDSPFPILKVTAQSSVRCLDLSQRKQKLAVVDETGMCQVFSTKNQELLYNEPNTNSIAWNTQYEDMLALSGPNLLSIKVEDFPAHRQKLNGFVVGLSGSKVFCLNGNLMSTLDLPLSAPMYQYIENKLFAAAHRVACLGVTDGDWEELANAALENLHFDIARLAFVKLQDYGYLELIRDLQNRIRKGDSNHDIMIGDIFAYRGRFKEAARMYQRAGQEHKALTMYTDMRMFDQAQDYLGSNDNSLLIRQKADWARNINEYKAAVDMYLSIGDTKSAVEILGEQNSVDQLVEVGRKLDKAERGHLIEIAEHLKRLNQSNAAAEIYKRLGDSVAVLSLHINAKEWAQAFAIIQAQPQHKALVYVPYAHWLAENDKFVQAQKAFHKAGRLDEAFNVLHQLTENAVNEYRFQDAGYYYWILGQQCLELARENVELGEEMMRKYQDNERLAGIFYAYHSLHRYLEEPFTSFMPEALFNISRFLLSEISENRPKGISLFNVLYCLSKQAKKLGANKFTKQLLDRMQSLRIPPKFQEQVELATISARARPYSDPEDLLPMCYRCSTYNPLAATNNRCVNCGQTFVHSFVSFEILPLVEFYLEESVADVEAVRLIETPAADADLIGADEWKQESNGNAETLQIDRNVIESSDPFASRINFDADDNKDIAPAVLNRAQLLALDCSSVLISKHSPPMRYQFYRNLLPDLQITMCEHCFKAFHVDDFELQLLQKGFCPFCRTTDTDILDDDLLTFS